MKKAFFILLFSCCFGGFAQEQITTFGFQFKPIVPSNLFNTGEIAFDVEGTEFSIQPKMAYSFGGVVRAGFSKWLSMESGINYVRRNYKVTVSDPENSVRDSTEFRIIGYEIPVLGMVYVQLSDYIFMDAAFGLSIDMFPSSVGSFGEDEYFEQRSFRRRWVQSSLLANIGWEWRTRESGYFYIGASYHRPFQTIYETSIRYSNGFNSQIGRAQLNGNYLTIDFRYFFHEEKREKKVKEEKIAPENLPSWMKYGK